MTATIIEARDVGVRIGGGPILAGVALRAAPGDIVAVVGENGAGKSTLLRCLAGLQTGVSGEVSVFGRAPVDEPAFWRDVALLADEPAWYPGLTVREHLEMMRAVHGAARMRTAAALEGFGLAGAADRAPLTLSTGQRQRLALAMTLVRPSRLLLLDEPERALDRAFRSRLAAHLAGYAGDGGTVVMATHDRDLVTATGARELVLGEPVGES